MRKFLFLTAAALLGALTLCSCDKLNTEALIAKWTLDKLDATIRYDGKSQDISFEAKNGSYLDIKNDGTGEIYINEEDVFLRKSFEWTVNENEKILNVTADIDLPTLFSLPLDADNQKYTLHFAVKTLTSHELYLTTSVVGTAGVGADIKVACTRQ